MKQLGTASLGFVFRAHFSVDFCKEVLTKEGKEKNISSYNRNNYPEAGVHIFGHQAKIGPRMAEYILKLEIDI